MVPSEAPTQGAAAPPGGMLPIASRWSVASSAGAGLPISSRHVVEAPGLATGAAGLPIASRRGSAEGSPPDGGGGAGLPIASRKGSLTSNAEGRPPGGGGMGLPIASRKGSLTSNAEGPPGGGAGLPIASRKGSLTSNADGRVPGAGAGLPIPSRKGSLTSNAGEAAGAAAVGSRRGSAVPKEEQPVDAAAARRNSSESDWSGVDDSPERPRRFHTMFVKPTGTDGSSNSGLLESPCKGPATAHRHSIHGMNYKAFIPQHGAEASVYDSYIFGHLLGEGATGSTWEACPKIATGAALVNRSGKCEGKCAIKKLPKVCVPKEHLVRFREEVEMLKLLDHPNICKLHEVFEDSHAMYLVMDLCAGGELFDRIVEDELGGEIHAANLTRQIAHALRYCHETHGIVHRDIKPENVLFFTSAPDAPVKLIDFGIACHLKPSEHIIGKEGTEAYLSPEVLKGEEYTEKCDLWSLGALLYIMLSGNMPFRSQADAMEGRFTFEGEEWALVSNEAKDLISRLLVVDQAKRYSAAQAVEHPWLLASLKHNSKAVPALVFTRLKRFKQTSDFRKVLLMMLSRRLGTDDLPDMYEAFKTMDVNGDGMLTLCELRSGVKNIVSEKMTAEEMEQLFEAIDVDGSGYINYSEFLAAALDRKLLFREDLCFQVFRSLDRDSDGYVSVQELNMVLHEVEMEDVLGKELRDEARCMLDRYDHDGDGRLDFREFTALITQNRIADLQKRGLPPRRRMVRAHSSPFELGAEQSTSDDVFAHEVG